MNLFKVLDSGDVVRYHCAPILHKQDLSSHLWESTIILKHIFPEASADLLWYVMTHDCSELYTSDIAAPVKVAYPEIKTIMDELEEKVNIEMLGLEHADLSWLEKLAAKHADILSGIYFTRKRIRQGDLGAQEVYDNWVTYYTRQPYLNFLSIELFEDITSG